MTVQDNTNPVLFGQWAPLYMAIGWHGVLPLPMRKKFPPPIGYTGAAGQEPDEKTLAMWRDGMARGNIALRLPPNIIGLDVDAYGDKSGAQTFGECVAKWGKLPATWRTTSRNDETSGIRLYRAPEGLAWPGEMGPGVEIVQHRHRYAVVPPSIHPEGMTYRWLHDDGAASITPPNPADLPELPASWVEGLTGGTRAGETTRLETDITSATRWLTDRARTSDPACRRMKGVWASFETGMATGSAHSAARTLTSQAIRLTDDGHCGALELLERGWQMFRDEVTTDGRGMVRDEWGARHEWDSLLASAVGLVRGDGHDLPVCDCDVQRLADWLGGEGARVSIGDDAPRPGGAPEPVFPDPAPLAAPSPQGTPESPGEAILDDSWDLVDMGRILAGEDEEDVPTALQRVDGRCMWYPGKVNGLLGASESGKTWVAYLAVRQVLQSGGRVMLLDFEDTPRSFVRRMRSLGLDEHHWERMAVVAPQTPFTPLAREVLFGAIERARPDLIILDGLNAAMTLCGLDLLDNKEVTRFFQVLLNPLAATGAAVAYIDHITKNRGKEESAAKGGIGAQAKRAMTSGCTLMVEVRIQPAPGHAGIVDLYVDKDRPGLVREHTRQSSFGQWAGSIHFDSGEDRSLDLMFTAPGEDAPQVDPNGLSESAEARIRRAILDAAAQPGGLSGARLHEDIKGRKEVVIRALSDLVDEGVIIESDPDLPRVHRTFLHPAILGRENIEVPRAPEVGVKFPEVPESSERGVPLDKRENDVFADYHGGKATSVTGEARPAPSDSEGWGGAEQGNAEQSSKEVTLSRARASDSLRQTDPGGVVPSPHRSLGLAQGTERPGATLPADADTDERVCQHCGTYDKPGYKDQCPHCYNPMNGSHWR